MELLEPASTSTRRSTSSTSRAATIPWRQITGVTVHETVPDSLLEQADEIELIDLSPDDLRKRLAEGKVYTAERAEVAAQQLLPHGQPDRAARDGAAPHGRACRPQAAGLHAGQAHRRAVEVGRAADGGGQSQPVFRAGGALDAAHGLQPGSAVAGRVRRDIAHAVQPPSRRSWRAT